MWYWTSLHRFGVSGDTHCKQNQVGELKNYFQILEWWCTTIAWLEIRGMDKPLALWTDWRKVVSWNATKGLSTPPLHWGRDAVHSCQFLTDNNNDLIDAVIACMLSHMNRNWAMENDFLFLSAVVNAMNLQGLQPSLSQWKEAEDQDNWGDNESLEGNEVMKLTEGILGKDTICMSVAWGLAPLWIPTLTQ